MPLSQIHIENKQEKHKKHTCIPLFHCFIYYQSEWLLGQGQFTIVALLHYVYHCSNLAKEQEKQR